MGFKDNDYVCKKSKKLVPSNKAYTNIIKKLKTMEADLKEVFNTLRNFMYGNLKDFGKDCEEDGKIIGSKAKGYNDNIKEDG